MIVDEEVYLSHIGTPRHSGRYPWGSGGNVTQHNKSLLDHIEQMRKQGLSEVEIAQGLGLKTTQLRAQKTIALNEQNQALINRAQRLRDKGYSNVAIGSAMGIGESSVRSLLAPGRQDKLDILQATSNMLKAQVDTKGFIDVGSGNEQHLGISETRLKAALAVLEEQGYAIHTVQVDQLGTNQKTLVKVLAPPGTEYKDIAANKDKIRLIDEHSEDGGRSYLGILPPVSVDSSRVSVRYNEDGGGDADGVLYVRPGVDDISLGKNRYAQVRVQVDGTHYLKGMAIYKDDLPDGVDIEFNTVKSRTGNKLDAMKALKDDPDNPFGAIVRQIGEKNEAGQLVKVTSAMNLVNEEGDWDRWAPSLSSQMLSKQSPVLAKSQLNMTYERKLAELDEIRNLTNPAVKKRLLEAYADDVDSSAVHLKAAALPRQASQVILPITAMKDTEIYAPNFKHGERVVLIRYPHGGTFEIPELIVNNKNTAAQKILGDAQDAVGIHPNVAKRLSGADFDGDTVLVIPNNSGKVKTSPALEKLKDFDPQRAYPAYEGMPKMDASTKQKQMGKVTNLIADMTIRGASPNDLARAVRHSMVVIDAEKHNLDYKQSALDNNIAQLKEKYQGRANAGAATLITRASSDVYVPKRTPRPFKDGGPIDKATGKKVFVETGESYTNSAGKLIVRGTKSKKLAETDDAFSLLSPSYTPIEKVYAEHSNKLKALANAARRDYVSVKSTPYSNSAKKVYADEVRALDAKLNLAYRNKPLERNAQIVANSVVQTKRHANPDMDNVQLKKIKAQALMEARNRVGAKKPTITITPKEWDAIQAGAITNHRLEEILKNADLEEVKKLATPRTQVLMTPTKKGRATTMLAAGYTQADVAAALGVSLTTLKTSIAE